MTGCPDCERKDRQIAAYERMNKLQAQEWERITGELDGFRRADELRRLKNSSRAKKGASARWKRGAENA